MGGALTPEGRKELLAHMAETHASNYIGYGWHIDNPDDLKAAT